MRYYIYCALIGVISGLLISGRPMDIVLGAAGGVTGGIIYNKFLK